MSSFLYLTASEVVAINRQLCLRQKQAFGLRDLPALQEAIQRPQVSIDGYEPFPELWEKAAVLLDSLLRNTPFLRLNALTGLLAADLMLEQNGQRFSSRTEDSDLLQSIGLQQVTILQIAEWLRSRSTGAL